MAVMMVSNAIMVRIQIQLGQSRHRDLKRRAKRLGVSVAEVVRRCVDAQFERDDADGAETRLQRAKAIAGRYTDPAGATRTASQHDAALTDAFRR